MARLHFLTGAALAVGILLGAREADAYCRTTTVKSPADYDSSANGCWAAGVPLFWRNACLGYSLQRGSSRTISYEDAADLISTAFTRWTGATCPTEGNGRSRTSIDVRDLGPADCAKVEYVSGVANQNLVLFRDDSWKYGKQVLGLTTVVYNPENGEIYNADMEMNMLDMDPLAIRDPVAPDAYDFASVVTHEAGHFLGIAHSDTRGATMFARYDPGQTSMRHLSQDDVAAICTVYRPDGDRPVLQGKVTRAPQCNPTPRGGYNVECQEKATGCAGATAMVAPKRDRDFVWIAIAGFVLVALRRARAHR